VFERAVKFAVRLPVLRHNYESTTAQVMRARMRDDLAPLDKVCRDEFATAKSRERE
jgi:hypothetical protein